MTFRNGHRGRLLYTAGKDKSRVDERNLPVNLKKILETVSFKSRCHGLRLANVTVTLALAWKPSILVQSQRADVRIARAVTLAGMNLIQCTSILP